MWGQGEKQGDQREAVTAIQVRDEDGSDPRYSSIGGEILSVCDCILKVEPAEFPDE